MEKVNEMDVVKNLGVTGIKTAYSVAKDLVDKTIKEKGGDCKIAFPDTAFFLPLSYAAFGKEVSNLKEAAEILDVVGGALAGVEEKDLVGVVDASVLAAVCAEIIEAVKYIGGNPYTGDWQGFIPDNVLRSLGLQLVDGRMPGVAVIVGAAPDSKIAADLVRGLQQKSILSLLIGNTNGVTLLDQLKQEKVDVGLATYVVPLGSETTSVVFAANFAVRAALIYGGSKKGEVEKVLNYCQQRVPVFIIALGALDELKVASALAAIKLGFPVVTDQEVPEVGKTPFTKYEALISEKNYNKIISRGISAREIKLKISKVDIPVYYGSAFEGERVRKEQMFAQFGGKYSTAFEYITTREIEAIDDGNIEVIGPEIDEMKEGEAYPLGIFVEVAGRKMRSEYEPIVERQVHTFLNEASGIFHMGQRDMCWLRISKEAQAKGFKIKHFGTILHAQIHTVFGAIVDKVSIKIYTDEAAMTPLLKDAQKVYEARDARMKEMTDESVDTFYSCTLCIPKGELVTLSDGSFDRIENIIRVAAEEEDIDVFSLKNPHFGAMPVGELFIHPAPKKITHIMMSNNNLLRLTANHKVLVDRNEGLMWIEAGKLKKEDRLLSAKTTCLSDKEQRENTPVFLIDLLPDEMKVFDNKFLLKLKKAMIEKYGSFGAAAGELGFGYHKLYTAFYFPCKRIYRLGFRRLTIGEIKLICSRIGWVWNEIKGEIKKFGVSRASGYELRKSVIDEDIMYLAGLIASDGCVRHRGKGTSVQFTNSEKALIDEFGRIIKDIFGVLPKTYKVKPIVSSSKGLTITGKKNIYVSQVNNSLIGRFMLSLGIGSKRGKGKKTASWMGEKISKSHPKLVCAFIKGLFDGDGHVTENHVLITTGTYAEAQHLFLLYKKAGISTYITEIKRGYQVGTRSFGDYTRFREIISSNHPAKKKIMHAVVPSFDDNHVVRVDAVPFKCGGILKQLLEKYKKNIEITKLAVDYKTIETWIKKKSRASKAKLSLLLESLKNKICKDDPLYLELLEWTRSNVIFEKVKSVKMAEYEEKEVYNFSVPGTHNYLVNGIVLKNCQSFAPNHVCIVKPERLGLCGAYNWLDAKASYELNPVGPNQPVKKGECLSAEKGEWKGVNDFIYQKSNKSLERFYAYSIIEWPETSCGCFECIIALVPEANGFMVVNREYSGMTPVGMKFTTLAGSVGGGAQTPGFMGIGRLYIVSKKFVKADGGLKRLVWMPKELKEALYDKLKKRGEEEGVADFVEKIADETNAVTSEELLAHLEKVGHPALTMDALI